MCAGAWTGQPRSSSLRCGRSRLTGPALRRVGRDRGSSYLWSGPAGRVVAGLVADQGVGDLLAQCAMAHQITPPCCRGPLPLPVGFRGRSHTGWEIARRRGGAAGRRVTGAGRLLRPRCRRPASHPAGDGEQRRKRADRQQLPDPGLCSLHWLSRPASSTSSAAKTCRSTAACGIGNGSGRTRIGNPRLGAQPHRRCCNLRTLCDLVSHATVHPVLGVPAAGAEDHQEPRPFPQRRCGECV